MWKQQSNDHNLIYDLTQPAAVHLYNFFPLGWNGGWSLELISCHRSWRDAMIGLLVDIYCHYHLNAISWVSQINDLYFMKWKYLRVFSTFSSQRSAGSPFYGTSRIFLISVITKIKLVNGILLIFYPEIILFTFDSIGLVLQIPSKISLVAGKKM